MILLIAFSVLPVGAYSPNDNNFNGIELSARRFSAKLIGKSDKALVEELLTDLGMSEKIISLIPDEKIVEISKSKNIGYQSDYCKIVDGEEIVISEEEFKAGEEISKQNMEIQPFIPGYGDEFELTDELLEKTLVYYETKNAAPGTFGVFTAYNFINYAIRYHGEDVLGQAGEHLIFDRNSFGLAVQYTYYDEQGTDTVQKTETEFYDTTYFDENARKQKRLKQKNNGITVQYNLKNTVFNMSNIKYTTATFLMMTSATVNYPDNTVNFNIYGTYFHQKIGLGSLAVKVDIDGATVKVTPTFIYDEHQINTSKHITYNPY